MPSNASQLVWIRQSSLRRREAVTPGPRSATVGDVHELALGMPDVERIDGPSGNAVYTIRRKSFVFFRNPRPDAIDPDTGLRYDDVIVLWVESEEHKRALVEDASTPFFTTPHFDGHTSVLIRACRLHELRRDELAEQIAEAWLARAPTRLAAGWLAEHPDWPERS